MNKTDYSEKIHLLQAEADKLGLRTAIVNYLTETADNCPGQNLPNGLSAEAAADAIIKTSRIYSEARDAQLSTEQMRSMIAENISDMTGEQAVQYLSGLHVLLGSIGKERNEALTPEMTEEQLAQQLNEKETMQPGMSIEEKVDELIDTMPRPDLDLLSDFVADQECQEAIHGDAQTEEQKTLEKLTWEENAIRVAVVYSEAAQGKIKNIDGNIDPGMLAATTGAYTDSVRIKQQLQKGEITEQEAQTRLSDVESALAVGLAAALGIALAVGASVAGILIGKFLMSVGWTLDAATFVASLICLFGIGGGISLYEYLVWKIPEVYTEWKKKNWKKIKKAKQTVAKGMTTVRNAIGRLFS